MSAPSDRPESGFVAVLAFAAAGWGAWQAASLAWVCDDAFLSFRYADHLVRGFGLVFNPGEAVEGYTNPLWTLLMAGVIGAGGDPVPASQYLGIAAFIALSLGLTVHAIVRDRPPIAGLALALTPDVQVWATGGLETAWFTAATTGALALASRHPAAAGLAVSACFAIRPDGALFLVPALWLTPKRATLLAAAAAATAPQLAFKWGYYGHLFPTAFWSKSALVPWYDQGIRYAAVFFAENPAWALLAAVAGWAAVRDDKARVHLAIAAWFGAYVLHSGGDYMHARRLLPILPFLALAAERAPLPTARAATVAALFTAWPMGWLATPGVRWWGVGDERAYYPAEIVAIRKAQGEAFARALDGVPARIVIEGGLLSFAYYSRWPYVVEATGLAHYDIAGQPLAARGHPGHEKSATPEWLDAHDVSLIIRQDPPPVRPNGRPDDLVIAGQVRAQVRYAHPALDALDGRPDLLRQPLADLVDRAADDARRDPAQAPQIRSFLESFAFSRRPDGAAWRDRFTARLEAP